MVDDDKIEIKTKSLQNRLASENNENTKHRDRFTREFGSTKKNKMKIRNKL